MLDPLVGGSSEPVTVDAGSQARALAFHRELGPLEGKGTKSHAAWLRFAPKAKRDAHRSAEQKAELAFEDGAALHADPAASQAEREASRVAYLQARGKHVELSDDLEGWRLQNRQAVEDGVRAKRIERAENVLARLDDVEAELREIAEDDVALARFRNDHAAGRNAPAPKSVRIAGGESLSNLRRGVEALLPKPERVLVSPVAMEALRRGEGVKDVDGNELSFETAQELYAQGLLGISFGRLGGNPS